MPPPMHPTVSTAPPPAPMGSPGNVMRHNKGRLVPAPQNALMMPPPQLPTGGPSPGHPRLDPGMLAGLPPEFVEALQEIAQLVDIDVDGVPDAAVIPLNKAGGQAANALMTMMGGGPAQPQNALAAAPMTRKGGPVAPAGGFPRTVPSALR